MLDCSLHADSLTLSMQASCSVESWLVKDSLVTCSAVAPPHPSKLPCSIEQHDLTAMHYVTREAAAGGVGRRRGGAGSLHLEQCTQLTEAPAKADSCTLHDTQPPSALEHPRPLRLCALQAAPCGKHSKSILCMLQQSTSTVSRATC